MREPDHYVRVDGRWLCPCGLEARDHKTSPLTDEKGDYLVELCDGRLAKL